MKEIVKYRGFNMYKDEKEILQELEEITGLQANYVTVRFRPMIEDCSSRFLFSVEDNNIIYLYILNAPIRDIPKSIKKLASLRFFGLYNTQTCSLPDVFGSFKNLEVLRVRKCNLTSLPETFGNLRSLRDLDLANNDLKDLPITLKKLKSLQKLNIAYNKFTRFPEVICRIPSLQVLNLSANDFDNIPRCIEKLINLKDISFYGDNLTVPAFIICIERSRFNKRFQKIDLESVQWKIDQWKSNIMFSEQVIRDLYGTIASRSTRRYSFLLRFIEKLYLSTNQWEPHFKLAISKISPDFKFLYGNIISEKYWQISSRKLDFKFYLDLEIWITINEHFLDSIPPNYGGDTFYFERDETSDCIKFFTKVLHSKTYGDYTTLMKYFDCEYHFISFDDKILRKYNRNHY